MKTVRKTILAICTAASFVFVIWVLVAAVGMVVEAWPGEASNTSAITDNQFVEAVSKTTRSSEPMITVLREVKEITVIDTQADGNVTMLYTGEVEIPEPKKAVKTQNKANERIRVTTEERELMARVVYLEAQTESDDGKQAVAEVILNRVKSPDFPDTVEGVIMQDTPCLQFTSSPNIDIAVPTLECYQAVDRAVWGERLLSEDVVFFSQEPENDNVYCAIGAHYFCGAY